MKNLPDLTPHQKEYLRIVSSNVPLGILKSVYITGSAAKEQRTIMKYEGKTTILSDLEFVIIPATIWFFIKINIFYRKIFSFKWQGYNVEITPVLPFMINRAKTPFIHGLKFDSVLLFGNDLRNQIKINNTKEIPRWEAMRLLYNRMIESIPALIKEKGDLENKDRYLIIKLYIAICDVYLILNKIFINDYKEKLTRLSNLRIKPILFKKIEAALRIKITGDINQLSDEYFEKEYLIRDVVALINLLCHSGHVTPPYPRPLNVFFQISNGITKRSFSIKEIISPKAIRIPRVITEILQNSLERSCKFSVKEKDEMRALYYQYQQTTQITS